MGVFIIFSIFASVILILTYKDLTLKPSQQRYDEIKVLAIIAMGILSSLIAALVFNSFQKPKEIENFVSVRTSIEVPFKNEKERIEKFVKTENLLINEKFIITNVIQIKDEDFESVFGESSGWKDFNIKLDKEKIHLIFDGEDAILISHFNGRFIIVIFKEGK
jgi:hypothetical protein